jgi:cell division protein FtsB
MQEEITKHTKKVYKTINSKNHTFKEKLKEIIVEIFIIVFAVTLSIWLHSLSEHRHQQKEVNDFLTDLKDDLKSDIESLTESKNRLSKNLVDCQFVLNLTQAKMDSIILTHEKIGFSASLSVTKFNNGNYEGFKSSGKIGYIENKNLKRQILKYYQEQTLETIEAEKFSTVIFEKILNFMSDNSEKGLDKVMLMPKLKQQLKIYTDNSIGLIDAYNHTIKEVNEILKEINDSEK